MWQRTWSHQTLDLLLHTGVLAIGHLYLNTTYAANNFYCTTCVKTHNLLQVVNRHEQCCSEQAWTVLCCTLWTLLSTVLFRSVWTMMFWQYISSMIAILFYVESTYLKKVVGTARIMLDISIVSYHVEYIICFSFMVYVIISCIISRHKNTQYILQKIYYWRQMIIHL